MPARRKRARVKVARPPITKAKLVLYALTALLIAGVFILVAGLTSGKKAFTVAVSSSPDIHIWSVDLGSGSITKIIVPAETEVELAMERGTLRAHSVWKLVESESLPGQLLADTVMRTFHTPIDFWADESSFKNILSKKTDIPFFLKLRTILLSKRKSPQEIKLDETSVLTRRKLTDGQEGYAVTGSLPVSLLSKFADSNISETQIAARIINETGEESYRLTDVVGVLEVLGAKVAPIAQGAQDEIDCVVTSNQDEVLERVGMVFNCEQVKAAPEAFDVELVLGTKFLKRF